MLAPRRSPPPPAGSDHKAIGPIARKILEGLVRAKQQKVVALADIRKGRDEMRRIIEQAIPSESHGTLHPGFAAYLYVTNWASGLAEAMQDLPELRRHFDRIAKAEDEYMPEGPPMSPITRSMFTTWSLWDLAVGVKRESLGSILLAVCRAQGQDPLFLGTLQTLVESSLGLYVHEGVTDSGIRLRDLATGELHHGVCSSGHDGTRGELWLARVLPSPAPTLEHAIVMTTPYVITNPTAPVWRQYLDRTLPKTKIADSARAYKTLMKRGLDERYWFEYVFEAYADHDGGAVFLTGLPDVAESRPHSDINVSRDASNLG
jgi:hypothetical protein